MATRSSNRIRRRAAAIAATAPAAPAPAAAPPSAAAPRAVQPARQYRAQPAAAAGPRLNFALTPYRTTNGVIDYSTSEGRKFYERATDKLNDDKYDCQADSLRSFLEDVKRRAQEFGWSEYQTGITQIPDNIANVQNTTFTDLITNYVEITVAHLTNF